MERLLQIFAVVLLAIAAFFFSRGDSDWLFACVVLSICAFFLSMRFKIKGRMREREAAKNPAELIEPLPDPEIQQTKDPHLSK